MNSKTLESIMFSRVFYSSSVSVKFSGFLFPYNQGTKSPMTQKVCCVKQQTFEPISLIMFNKFHQTDQLQHLPDLLVYIYDLHSPVLTPHLLKKKQKASNSHR